MSHIQKGHFSKVIYIAQNILDGQDGATSHVENTVLSFSRHVEEVTLVTRCTKKRHCKKVDHCSLIEVPTPFEGVSFLGLILWQVVASVRVRKYLGPGVVVYQRHMGGLFLPLLFAKIARCPSVLEINSDLMEEYRQYGRRWLLSVQRLFEWLAVRLAGKSIMVSWGIQEAYERRYGFLSGRTKVVTNGYNPNVFFDKSLDRPRNNLIWVGALYPWQGVDVALRMLRVLLERSIPCTLDVVGDGPMKSDMVALANELGLGDSVQFHGWVEERRVNDLLNCSTIALAPFAPAKGEIMALKLFAYAATGTPIVVSDSPGLPRTLSKEEAAVLVGHPLPEEYADAVQSLLDDDQKRKLMSRQLKEFARHNTWDHQTDSIIDFIAV